MPSNTKKSLSANADKLRELLNPKDEQNNQNNQSIEYIKSSYNFDDTPQVEDLINLIKAVENVNQQLLAENKFLKEQTEQLRANIFKLVEENTILHKELKNTTIMEILTEFETIQQKPGDEFQAQQPTDGFDSSRQKSKNEELLQSQLLINELQKKLSELSKNNRTKKSPNTGDTLENVDSLCCTKCNEELEIKIRQIEGLKNEIEQLNKSSAYMKNKIAEFEVKETEFEAQIKKHVDLVNHLEMEKNQAINEKEQMQNDKINSEKKLESILTEFNERMSKEKEIVVSNIDTQLKSLLEQNQTLEERLFKQESLIDRLTRDKVSLTSEVDSYKKKCNSIDFDSQQMAEKLRQKYMDALIERDRALNESNRIRHDYDSYVKQYDQDKFCLREELNNARNRLIEIEKDLLLSREQCIQLTEEINKLNVEIVNLKHSKDAVEAKRNDGLKDLTKKYEKRECELATGIEALQARYCVTVKELEDLAEAQKKLINKLRSEVKVLNEQLEILVAKYRNDTTKLSDECEELTTRLSKYKERVNELEEQSIKHNEMHEKMKIRIKEMADKILQQQEEKQKLQSSETLMKTTNLKLIQDINNLKSQLAMFTVPSKYANDVRSKQYSVSNPIVPPNSVIGDPATLNSVRSLYENSLFSTRFSAK